MRLLEAVGPWLSSVMPAVGAALIALFLLQLAARVVRRLVHLEKGLADLVARVDRLDAAVQSRARRAAEAGGGHSGRAELLSSLLKLNEVLGSDQQAHQAQELP